MKTILLLGTGQSSTVLIEYLSKAASSNQWKVTIADKQINNDNISGNLVNQDYLNWRNFDVLDVEKRDQIVQDSDLVISMMPARFHPLVLESCIKYQKDLLTPSYISREMKTMESEVERADILVLNELGLDPGIDHMSAMQAIDKIKGKGYTITCFESFTGGLVAPGSDENAWGYKFSWNPRNVVLAGHGGAVRFLHNGKYKYIPYHRVFRRTERIEIEGYGSFEGYANRDSLHYLDKYDLHGVSTIYRGTLRRPGFCKAWDVFVQLGATDDSFVMEGSEDMTYREFINSFLPYNPTDSVELKVMHYLHIDQDSDIMDKLLSLNIFSDKRIGLKNATPAMILEHILKESWTLAPKDKDMVVMWHKLFYHNKEEALYQTKSMVVEGENANRTAMAKTVGLPLGIAAKLILQGKIRLKGLQIPVVREIYRPILNELAKHQIIFKDFIEPQTSIYHDQPIF